MQPSLLRFEALNGRTGLSRSDIYRRLAAGTFPKPITITNSRIRVWVSEEVDSWVQEQIAANRGGLTQPKGD
jgi:prophage regulatory protein